MVQLVEPMVSPLKTKGSMLRNLTTTKMSKTIALWLRGSSNKLMRIKRLMRSLRIMSGRLFSTCSTCFSKMRSTQNLTRLSRLLQTYSRYIHLHSPRRLNSHGSRKKYCFTGSGASIQCRLTRFSTTSTTRLFQLYSTSQFQQSYQ